MQLETGSAKHSHALSELCDDLDGLAIQVGARYGRVYLAAAASLRASRILTDWKPQQRYRGPGMSAKDARAWQREAAVAYQRIIRTAQSGRSDLMQHLDDAHACAEAWLAEWLTSKPKGWRALLVKDVLARLRVILWCSERSWKSSRREIDRRLTELASGYWSGSVLRGRDR